MLSLLSNLMQTLSLYSAETGGIYSPIFGAQTTGTPPPTEAPVKQNGGIMGTIFGENAYCLAGTCTTKNANGDTLTLTNITSLDEAREKVKAFEATNSGRYQLTEWVSDDGSMRWTPAPKATPQADH